MRGYEPEAIARADRAFTKRSRERRMTETTFDDLLRRVATLPAAGA
jgi:hypothetical protein